MKKLFGYSIALSASLWGQTLSSPDINGQPTRQFGHPSLQIPPTQATPNYVEGREFDIPGQIAFDTSVNPPIMYVADIGNNRVLAFKTGSLPTSGGYADLVIGQQDFQSTIVPLGVTTGLNTPTGVAVDSQGNVYVADAGDNRILRFPAPFSQTTLPVTPDLVIGQKTFNNIGVNAGGTCANNTVAFTNGNSTYVTGLAIDGSGNLWTTDPGNNRVLMFPVANLTANAVQPAATMVIGQNSFTACGNPTIPNNTQTQAYLGGMLEPSSLAFDASGDLYVVDGFSRVLYYAAGFAAQGQFATRVLGVVPAPANGQPQMTYPNQYSLGMPGSNGCCIAPNGVFTSGNHVFVADTPANRVVEYDIPSNWPPGTTAAPSPASLAIIGQTAANVGTANQSLPQPSQYTLASPYGGAFSGTTMWVSDAGNSRVLGFPLPSSGGYSAATTVVGQTAFLYNAPNLIEGREVNLTASSMVVDNSSSPPHLYISDPGNNRILCFKNALIVGQSTPPAVADMVIGQPDLYTSEVNYPTGVATTPTATGLNTPIGVVVDNNGNLYVADSGNGRVLRFPSPFNNVPAAGTAPSANLVLGQSGFTSQIKNPEANSMSLPWGVALFAGGTGNATPLAGGLAVSDPTYNRVLIFAKPSGGDFTNGEAATLVIGQSTFTAVLGGSGDASFNSPRGIASDTSDRLYVADSGNNRIMEFTGAPESVSNLPTATNSLTGFNQPQSVAINALSTELWVADTASGVIQRFPEYNTCLLNGCSPTAQIGTAPAAPLGLTVDGSGNIIVGDTFNHVTLYFAEVFYKNAASFTAYEGIAPGMLTVLGRLGKAMSISSSSAQTLPWSTTMADLNLAVSWPGGPAAGTLAPIFATNSTYGAIYFQVPGTAPTSGTANFVVTQASTGAILGAGQFPMAKADPAFFTTSQNGLGPVAALNYLTGGTVTVNTAANPVARGGTIIFCLTGQGVVSGGPAQDGAAPPALSTPVLPTLVINGAEATVGYSGLGCGYPGLWQINATVPMTAIPNSQNTVGLLYLGYPSTIGGNNNSAADGTPGPDVKPIVTTIWVGN
jgi:uncharacterized protein (TIGR03437 family)